MVVQLHDRLQDIAKAHPSRASPLFGTKRQRIASSLSRRQQANKQKNETARGASFPPRRRVVVGLHDGSPRRRRLQHRSAAAAAAAAAKPKRGTFSTVVLLHFPSKNPPRPANALSPRSFFFPLFSAASPVPGVHHPPSTPRQTSLNVKKATRRIGIFGGGKFEIVG